MVVDFIISEGGSGSIRGGGGNSVIISENIWSIAIDTVGEITIYFLLKKSKMPSLSGSQYSHYRKLSNL
jgi:hypothetical protein